MEDPSTDVVMSNSFVAPTVTAASQRYLKDRIGVLILLGQGYQEIHY